MDRHPVTWDDAAAAVAAADHRQEGRIVADAVHAAGYLVPGRLNPDSGAAVRRHFAACLVRDALSLLRLAGGGPVDVDGKCLDLDLYRRADDRPDRADGRASDPAAGDVFLDYPDAERLAPAATATVVVELIPAAGPDYVITTPGELAAAVDGSALAARAFPVVALTHTDSDPV